MIVKEKAPMFSYTDGPLAWSSGKVLSFGFNFMAPFSQPRQSFAGTSPS
jgi:hypothetical protein